MKDNIVPVDVRKQYMADMQRYSLYVLYERYIPAIDGLKPVQRRILYCMWHDIKCTSLGTKRKSANTVGTVIAKYHSHGDCLGASTCVFTLSGELKNIEDMYNSGIRSFESLGVNETTGKVEPIVVTNLRIGQYTNKIYHIYLSNGTEIKCTSNHPIMLNNGMYVQAKNIRANNMLNTAHYYMYSSNTDLRPKVNGKLIQDIVWEHYYGKLPKGYVKHHIDGNKFNNSINNLAMMTRAEHALEHGDYNTGLELGRIAMKDPTTVAHARNYVKNKKLIALVNKDQTYRKFRKVIDNMIINNLPITEEVYETYRDSVYNLPRISTLIKDGRYGSTFEELVAFKLKPVTEMYAEAESKKQLLYHIIDNEQIKNEYEYHRNHNVKHIYFGNFDNMIYMGLPITYENYIRNFPITSDKFNEYEFNKLLSLYHKERLFVTGVYVEDVDNVPMYDFTVDSTHNMLFPMIGPNDNFEDFPMVCMHNSAVYEAMKPMTNWYEIKCPLIVYDSNSGSIQGGPQAAMRYTESCLSQFSMDALFGDLIESKMVVDWSKTFDNHTEEPDLLPIKIPLLLVNGTFGIAIGRRIEVPKHSLNDVIDATINVLKNPNAKVILIPDPCQKCEVVDTDWKKISNMGFGYFTERGIVDIESDKNGNQILHIRSMPDMIFANTVLDKIEDLIKENKLVQINDIQDHSTEEQLDIWLILKKGSDAEYVKQVLYKNTPLQDTKRVNMEVMIGDEIKRLSYKAYIVAFIELRRNVKFRLYNARLQKAETRLHTIELFIAILESGDVENIIHAIRNQKPSEEVQLIEWLMKKLKITDLQAKFILNTEIKKLSKGNLNRYKEEQKELNKQVKHYINMITKPELIDKEIEEELLEIRKKYGQPRKSVVISEAEASDIPQGTFKIVVSEMSFIKKMQVTDPIKLSKGDSPKCITVGDNSKDLLLFDEMGKVFRLPIHKLAFTDKNSPGIDIRMVLKKLTSNIVSVMYLPIIENLANKSSKYFIVTVTKQGLIKKMDLDDIISATPSGIIYSKLNKGDSVCDIVIANHKSDVIIYNKTKAIRISIDSIPYLKRSTLGSISMKTNEPIDGISVVTSDTKDVVVVTAKGKFNRISQSALARTERNRAGSKVIKLTKGDYIKNIFTCSNNMTIRAIHMDGTVSMVKTSDISMGSSVSSGDKLTKEIVKAELIKEQ